MIRILHVVTDMNRGGIETMLMNYYRHIDRKKIQFDFLTHRSEPSDYDEEILSLGGTIYHLPRLNPFSINYKRNLGEFFDTHPEYQIVHVHQDCMSSVVLKVARKHGLKYRIAHAHCTSQIKNYKYPIKMFYRNYIATNATHLLACGEDAGRWMFKGAPFVVLNNAINANEYRYDENKYYNQRKQWGISNNELIIGNVARFSPQKNQQFLLEVFYEIQKKFSAKLLLVGDGVLRQDIENRIDELGLKDKVILTGVRSDVSELMQVMDVFVLPSRFEGLPVTIIEAQAAGLPCFISDKVSIECNITNNVQQLSLRESVNNWADKIISVKDKPRSDTYYSICNSGYDIKTNVKWLTDYYMKLWDEK